MTGALMCGVLSAVVATRADAVAFNVSITLSPNRIQAGTTQTTTATVTVSYNGVGQPNQWVRISTDGDATPQSQDCFTAGLAGTCPPVTLHAGTTSGYQTITAAIDTAKGNGTVTGSASARLLQYYPANTISESMSPTNALTADGISTVAVTATVTDGATPAHGSIGQAVTISTTDPKVLFTPVTDNGDGTYTTTMSAIPGAAATDTVTAAVASGPSTSQTVNLTNPTPRVVGPLSTSGSQILDGNVPARPVVLKGVDAVNWGFSTTAWDSDPTGYYGAVNPGLLTPNAVGNMYRWGVNSVRLMLSTDLYLQNCPGETYPVPQATYAADVRKEVNLITSFGMVAEVDLHFVNPKHPNGNCYYPATASSDGSVGQYGGGMPLPPASDATAFFRDLASHLGGNPLVAFELDNEPNICELTPASGSQAQSDVVWSAQCPQASADLGWANDGTFVSQGTVFGPPISYPAAGMKTLYNTVRTNGAPNNLVLVDSNKYASDGATFNAVCATQAPGCVWQGPTNLVYVFHYYDCSDTTPAGQTTTQAHCNDPTPEAPSTIQSALSQRFANRGQWSAPVDLGEFGWPQNEVNSQYGPNNTPTMPLYQHGYFVNNVIAYLNSQGISYGLFAYQNDTSVSHVWPGAYALDTDGTTVPWTANDDGQAAINDMKNNPPAQYEYPPAGYG